MDNRHFEVRAFLLFAQFSKPAFLVESVFHDFRIGHFLDEKSNGASGSYVDSEIEGENESGDKGDEKRDAIGFGRFDYHSELMGVQQRNSDYDNDNSERSWECIQLMELERTLRPVR